ncbi:dTMP kinase [Nonomuraea basaltis]|uniref:dTMP kinase n=1 Tax=Nonomuraea basaltis TaxID=2495887 RepID=UPI00110C690C|nr:AAA family ATPase [Nonomuraea basaltis]TMR95669.1 thymidylate kinase [Nonomuraea basaltis]
MAGAPGRLITVAGIDGAGKSTLATSLHAALKDSKNRAILVGKHTTEVAMSADLSEYVDSVNAVVYRRKPSVGAACGNHYWLFALAAWYTLQDQLIIRPALRAGVHVILDNAHHKILARYAVCPNIPADLARHLFAHLTTPDLVLFLHVTAEEALRRKGGFSALEAGGTGSTGEAFISYQTRVTEELRRQATGATWASIDVTSKDAAVVLAETLTLLSDRLDIQIPEHLAKTDNEGGVAWSS